MGAPATDERMALQKITDLCIVRGLAEVMDNYYQLERACFQIVNNESDAVSIVNQVSPAGIAAMASSSSDIYNFYQGQPASCENITLAKGDWELLMSEVTLLAGLAEDAMTAVISQTVTVEMTALRDSMDRLVMGSPHPLVPVQPTQALFDRIINQLQPLVETFLEADPTYQVVAPQGTSIVAQAKGLLRLYTDKALELEPGWPGQRVRVAMWQVVLAKKVYREAMAERFDVGRQLLPAEQEFETAHQQLKDGGDGFAAIIDEREDLLSQWNRIGEAWAILKNNYDETNLAALLTELEASLPLFAIQDVASEPSVPYGFYIAYGVLGTLLLICICAAFLVARKAMQKGQQAVRNQSAV